MRAIFTSFNRSAADGWGLTVPSMAPLWRMGLLLSVLVLISACSWPFAQTGDLNQNYVIVHTSTGESHQFEVEIARTNAELTKGLRHRTHMAEDAGMLFDLGQVRLSNFTMSDTLIPLDMLFLSRDGTIVTIHHKTEPLNRGPYSSEVPVKGVLEINGGLAKQLEIKTGDKIVHPVFDQTRD